MTQVPEESPNPEFDPAAEDAKTGQDQGRAEDAAADSATPASPAAETDPEAADPAESAGAEAVLAPENEAKELRAELQQMGDELARAKADLYNLNEEYRKYVRRSKAEAPVFRTEGQLEVLEALLSVLDDLHGAREHGDLAEGTPHRAIADKLEETLQKRFEMVRYGQVGEAFDPQLHDALMATEDGTADYPVIAQVLQPGYRAGERVLRPTKVMVSNPAPQDSPSENQAAAEGTADSDETAD